jgi:hypothetical protein
MSPVNLLPLLGSTNTFRFPTVLGADDIFVTSSGEATIDGLVVAFDKFNLQLRSQAKLFTMTGNLVARRFICQGRSEFDISSSWWKIIYDAFTSQLNNPPATRISYFPVYCNNLGLLYAPKVNFGPSSGTIVYLWPTSNMTVFVADPTDGGLRWELVDWRDIR